MANSRTTTDHREIRAWIEDRNGEPAIALGKEKENTPEWLRVLFPDENLGGLKSISWDYFFEKFEEKNLAFSYQDQAATNQKSRFYEFVYR